MNASAGHGDPADGTVLALRGFGVSYGERRVLMDVDLINEVKNRIVCDNNNVVQGGYVACVNSSPPVRVEGGPTATLAEANSAYDLGGAVYDNYLAFGGIDLTDLIGRVVDGGSTKALAQTVR